MSKDNVQVFFKQVAEDEELREEMKSMAAEKQDEELVSAYCALAAERGLEFSAEELMQFRKSALQPDGELDDAALERVNAGSFWTNILRDVNNVNSWFRNALGTDIRPDDDRKSANRALGYDDP